VTLFEDADVIYACDVCTKLMLIAFQLLKLLVATYTVHHLFYFWSVFLLGTFIVENTYRFSIVFAGA